MPGRRTLIEGFWDRFDEACYESGYTKNQLAREIGCGRKTLYRGDHTPNPLFLARVAVKLNVTTDYLLGIERRDRN